MLNSNKNKYEDFDFEYLYKHIVRILKLHCEKPFLSTIDTTIIKKENFSDDEIIKLVNSEILLRMFAMFKENTTKTINELRDENNKLFNKMKSIYFYLTLLDDKYSKIIKHNENKENKLDPRHNILNKSLSEEEEEDDLRNVIKFKIITKRKTDNTDEIFKNIKSRSDSLLESFYQVENILLNNLTDLKLKQYHLEKVIKELSLMKKYEYFHNNPIMEHFKSLEPPRWVPNAVANLCRICSNKFSIWNRKHHCRVCGDVFCGKCCSIFETFQPYYNEKVRMCEDCHKYIKNSNTKEIN